jgi:transcriptional regulator with XRE-family HTH domain
MPVVTRARKPSQRIKTATLDTVKNLTSPEPDPEAAGENDTALDGPKIHANLHMEESVELLIPQPEDEFDEMTIDRGSKPPRPSSSRRLSPTLMQIFARRRKQIGLSLEQIAKVSGVEKEELERFENTQGAHRLLYDHAVVVARVLGLKPNDLPGLRSKEDRDDAQSAAAELYRAVIAGPTLTFEGKSGERFGGDVERVLTTPAFALKVGDDSLGAPYPKGTLLFFTGGEPKPGDVALLRHKRSKTLALRRMEPPKWNGLASWQPQYPVAPEWVSIGRLQVVLPRPPL